MNATSPALQRTARQIAAEAVAQAAGDYPEVGPAKLDLDALSPRDSRLALAIYRTAMQRWITLEYLLDLNLRKRISTLEPRLRGVLISAAAQIVFLTRLPIYAIVDESVRIARTTIRPGAAALVNAVLRRISSQVQRVTHDQPWTAGADCLPLGNGSIKLAGRLLPEPAEFESHLCIATSHPRRLIKRWVNAYGKSQTTAICLHGIQAPPTIVAMEQVEGACPEAVDNEHLWPHAMRGFVWWRGGHEQLVAMIDGHPARRVQDPASARAIEATGQICPKWCLDYCAGLGTKTRQMAWMHRQAQIIATDAAADRLVQLRKGFHGHRSVRVVEPNRIGQLCPAGGVDLLVLDVPCSNTAVLARRPEARYRFNDEALTSLVRLQRRIIEQAKPWLRSGGHLLYSTCSLEKEENQNQAKWIIQRYGASVVSESQMLPAGMGDAYHDGSYHALVKMG